MKSMFKSGLMLAGFAMVSGLSSSAFAMSLDWTGNYRFEAVHIDNTTLSDPKDTKSYFLHNLVLAPRVIAADGIEVVGQFSFLGNTDYPGSMVGQRFGGGTRNANESHVLGRNAGTAQMEVRELYLNINQEFGQIVLGRAPIEFGLGMTYNAGRGAFDHWGDTHDFLGYKFLIGNLSLMPMIGKSYTASAAQGSEVNNMMIEVMYDNKETESQFGVLYATRHADKDVNDVLGYLNPGATLTGSYDVKDVNLFIGRGWEGFKFKLEAGFKDGKTGLTINNEEVKANGYAIVMDLAFPREDSKWDWNFKTGIVSGDNPNTNSFEGYHLSRNFDVAFLMFNHPLGGYDLLRTGAQRNRDAGNNLLANKAAFDEETMSNTMFINPSFTYKFGERWSWRNSLVYAQLQTSPVLNNDGAGKNLGFEWDTALIYRSVGGRFQWVNEVGVLSPGDAWKEGNTNRDNKFTFGIQSKAAITF